ncbi:predicted protein [Naegleria gruberi]|uniref:palmitoyl-CoA hydrolase n=1 Tax=Naegleria gruberi TaxID=5762 RepID=D2W3H6_NAEGR|nr:uncharacterized protein NAEGRDRAFT_75947 [Naegleria gruberi]EFC36424.1 predicted protein [Naegleria gruberi]|eukprot:XP_002669168.1 predicted protein [Naegleria gruberi strain NEG-M]
MRSRETVKFTSPSSLRILTKGGAGNKPFLPILLMHGILCGNNTLKALRDMIKERVPPGTIVYSIPSEGMVSSVLTPVSAQLEDFRKQINIVKKNFGITDHHLICHSQGGLICRSYLQTTPDHNVKVFISLSGVQNGEYGVPVGFQFEGFLKQMFPFLFNTALEDVYKIFYTAKDVDYARTLNYRENMLRIDKMVLTGSPQDDIIVPYQSALFEFYQVNSTGGLDMIPMEQQRIYQNDVFGLKTLNEENRLVRIVVPNVYHVDWLYNPSLVDKCMIPYLY